MIHIPQGPKPKPLGPAILRIRPGEIRFAPKARNFLIQEISHPCARPYYVYIQTFIPAFLKLFITLILLQMDDVIRDWAGFKAGDAPDGARRRGSHFRKLRVIQSGTFAQRIARQGLRTVIRVTMPLEVIGFTTLMYTAGDRFFYDWQSLLKMSDFCTRSAQTGPLTRSLVATQVSSNPSGQGFGYVTLVQNRASWHTTSLGCLVPEGNLDIFATLTVQRDFSPLAGVQLGLKIIIGGKLREFKGDVATIPQSHQIDLIVRAEVRVNIGQTANIGWVLYGPSTGTGFKALDGDVHVVNNIR